jgi:hypothetical protein
VIPRYFVVAEAAHELQNPTSPEKIVLLGERLGLDAASRVLDIASAVERAAAAGLEDRLTFELGDGAVATSEPESYDAALCLGASFVFGGLADTVDALEPAVRPGGHVVVGEPFWRRLPLPDDYEDRRDPWTSLEGTVQIFEASGLPVVSVIASSEDDWDRYETLHWHVVERWLAENPDDADASEIRAHHERSRRTYLRHGRDLLGWAILVGWKRP